MKHFALTNLLSMVVACALMADAVAQQPTLPSPVTVAHLSRITALFKTNGIRSAQVRQDRLGRVELQGDFENEREVDRAFSLAQTVVGVRWVSPVTPQRIKVKEWEECLSNLLSGQRCGGQAAAPGKPDDHPPGPVGEKYALVVGVGTFKNRIQPLQYANKDAYDFYAYLVDPAGGNFKRQNVVLLRDENATRENVVRVLDDIEKRAQENDLVVLYLSSHGTPPDKFGGVNVVTYDSEVKPRERIWQTSLTEGILRDFVQNVRAKRLVVIMDACYSNGAYRQIAGFLPEGGKSLDGSNEEGVGRSRQDMARRLLGAKDLVIDESGGASPRPGQKDIPDGWGKVLMSASDAGERSWESDELRNSVFTRFLLDGLQRNHGALRPAFDQARAPVKQQVRKEKGPEIDQNPQVAASRRDWNIPLAIAGR